MDLFKRNKKKPIGDLSPVLTKADDPVNYNSVLDYLVGLSKEDYAAMIKVTGIYRDANKKAADVLKVEDQPTSQLKPDEPTDDEIDQALDDALDADLSQIGYEPTGDTPVDPKIVKPHAPSPEKKIDVTQD